jgi:APA family basic amino acid/polyamine antiporter
MAFAFVMTGIVNYTKLNVADPAAYVLKAAGQGGLSFVVTIGALIGMFTAVMSMIFSSSRLIYSIGRDGLLPKALGNVNKTGTPTTAIWIAVIVEAIVAGLLPFDILFSLINAGTLISFIAVNIGIFVVRRRTDFKQTDGFVVPWYPILPILGTIFSVYFLIELPNQTHLLLLVWMIIGLIIYALYGAGNSKR